MQKSINFRDISKYPVIVCINFYAVRSNVLNSFELVLYLEIV